MDVATTSEGRVMRSRARPLRRESCLWKVVVGSWASAVGLMRCVWISVWKSRRERAWIRLANVEGSEMGCWVGAITVGDL